MASPWDEGDRLAQLRKLWKQRLPVGVIADRLNVSVAAVTSKSRREGLDRRENPSMPRLPKLGDTLPQIIGRRTPGRKKTLPPLDSVQNVVQEPSAKIVILRSRPSAVGQCCWPINNGRPWRYCDDPTVPGHHYCARHRKISRDGRAAATDEGHAPSEVAAAGGAQHNRHRDTQPNASESSNDAKEQTPHAAIQALAAD